MSSHFALLGVATAMQSNKYLYCSYFTKGVLYY